MISYGFPFEKPVRQIDGSEVVARVRVRRRRDRRLHLISTVGVEFRSVGKPSDRNKTIATRALRDPLAYVTGHDFVERRADQIDLVGCPRARNRLGAEFRTLLAGAG
jgi:hypothetical protein